VVGDADLEFDYVVNGVRRGFDNYQPYRKDQTDFRPTIRGVPFGQEYPQAMRDILVSNGILNADYTPNEATAARLGWQLRDPQAVRIEERHWLSTEVRDQMIEDRDRPVRPVATAIATERGSGSAAVLEAGR
jgi:hypothetical protein